MTKNVLYLCRGAENSDEFFFAQELPEGFYSPGLFVIEARTARGMLHDAYRFAARQGDQVLNLELKATENGRAFVTDAATNGKFYFKAVTMSRETVYAGRLTQQFDGLPFFRLEPANMQQLEQACRQSDFYFTGSDGG